MPLTSDTLTLCTLPAGETLAMAAIGALVFILTFLLAAAVGRGFGRIALIVATAPAAFVGAVNPGALGQPLVWLYILSIWLPLLVAALAGAWFARVIRSAGRRVRR